MAIARIEGVKFIKVNSWLTYAPDLRPNHDQAAKLRLRRQQWMGIGYHFYKNSGKSWPICFYPEGDMKPLANAYDNIRLTRRKVNIAQQEIEHQEPGPRRDEAVMRAASLTEDLVRAVQDFADLGYEEELAALLAKSPSETQRPFYRLR